MGHQHEEETCYLLQERRGFMAVCGTENQLFFIAVSDVYFYVLYALAICAIRKPLRYKLQRQLHYE